MNKTWDEQLSTRRRVLGNPYAYQDGEGRISAVPDFLSFRKDSYTDDEIRQTVRAIHIYLWVHRAELGFSQHAMPIDVLRPEVALSILGFCVEVEETLGFFRDDGGREIEVAGIFDSDNRVVRISRQFPLDVRAFTLAHELGHAVYAHQTGVHRDRPLIGTTVSLDPNEAVADKFSTFFLMPEKIVRKEYEKTFLASGFVVNEATVYAIARCDLQAFLKKYPSKRAVARLLASTERFNGEQIIPFARRFGVSVEAMAIRLEELEIIRI